MNILCFSDLHRDQDAAEHLVEMAAQADLVIGAGDFANRHQGLSDTLDILRRIEKPTCLVPGNGETVDEFRQATRDWANCRVLHGDGWTLPTTASDIELWGVGGGIPVTPFGDWSYDFDEETATEMLAACPSGGILVTHSPPIDTVDHDSAGRIRGSHSIRACVLRCQPKLVVCGHIHSDWGKQVQLGTSLILNAGPAGTMIQLD
ncbi:metallophosphoesterase family protein [Allorhodopirellula heiligendammensis]|uniref:Calcineurin-like phosphoesterase superfamily domain protein n=1 Tax=Allorhodopirellula heiligendammensis TaxID=2714739 RepID=A0A5C6BG23_9BACT|nr:metallophosphoesterase [Allorhodopirellula heiligendammensis]TWU10451.1 Calcineurin-like phosphoesterase superfamily domain protein [Allorhodopirellula heiligendammensis]